MIEQIDNSKYGIKRGEYERFIKKQTHKLRRRLIKAFLRGNEREPNDKQYKGWSI